MIPFSGTVWRILAAERAGEATAPARHPEGRFHHSGQTALYASLTAEGAGVAIARYLAPGDGPRVIVPLRVEAARIADHRGEPALSVIWQEDRAATGAPSPTWAFSDAARRAGAQGLLYSSRSRPELAHLVLFDLSPGLLTPADPLCYATQAFREA
ncbi:RES family NAD+ phosphorylase [Rhodobacter maris]|uniref:RES domain-containing protein n=1 Tax=Rhodobacter maris TaxID=446682 RepID=A0A285SBW6_9RHOB|nr:RES family NAD+ phosphorylase [Rhodobacter maris]SOC05179.1 RES domain-containing protein [Rhodobacter maris]